MKRSVFALVCVMGGLSLFGAERPEVAFVKAIKAGKPLTAEVSYRQAVEENSQLPARFHYEGARVAEMCGKDLLARDRYARFVREEKGNTPELKAALWRLIRTSQDLEVLERLCQVSPKDEAVYGAGAAIMRRQRESERYNEVIATAGVLLKYFDADRVFGEIYSCLATVNDVAYSKERIGALLRKYPCPGSPNYDRTVGRWPWALGPDGLLSVTARAGKLVKNDAMTWAFQNADHKEANAAVALKAAKTLEPLVLAEGTTPAVVLAWYNFAANHRKEYFADVDKESGRSGACAERMLKILAIKDVWAKANRSGGLLQAIENGFNGNHWTPAGAAKIAVAAGDRINARYLWRYLSSKADIAKLCEEAKSGEPIEKVLKRFPERTEEFLGEPERFGAVCKWGTAAQVKTGVRALTTNGVDFDYAALRPVFACGKLSADELADVLQSCLITTGWSKGWEEFAKQVKNNSKDKVFSNAKMRTLASTVKNGVQAGDPLLRAVRAACDRDATAAVEGLEEVMKCVKTYPDQTKRREMQLVGYAIGQCMTRVWDGRSKRERCGRFVDIVLAKANSAFLSTGHFQRLRDLAMESTDVAVADRFFAWRAKNAGETSCWSYEGMCCVGVGSRDGDGGRGCLARVWAQRPQGEGPALCRAHRGVLEGL